MLDTVNLNHIVTREGGWDTAADWKVRMMMLEMIMIIMVMVVMPIDVKCPGKKENNLPVLSSLKTSTVLFVFWVHCSQKNSVRWVGGGGSVCLSAEKNSVK